MSRPHVLALGLDLAQNLECRLALDQRLDAEIGDGESKDVLDRDMTSRDVGAVQQVESDLRAGTEMEMWMGDVTSLIRMPVEDDNFLLVPV